MLWEHVCSDKHKLVWMGKGRIQPHILLGEWIQALSVEVFLRISVVFVHGRIIASRVSCSGVPACGV